MKKILLITALSVCFIGGCQTDDRTDSPMNTTTQTMTNTDSHQLTETKWQLFQFKGKTIKQNTPKAELPYIILHTKDRRIVGLAGCNRFFGTYTLANNQLRFSQLGMTMMACYDLPVAEHKFIETLGSTDNYTIKNNQLIVKQGNKTLAVFQATK